MSPLPVDNLTPDSDIPTIRKAISDSVAACMNEPSDDEASNKQQQCAATAFNIAREKTGQELSEGSIR